MRHFTDAKGQEMVLLFKKLSSSREEFGEKMEQLTKGASITAGEWKEESTEGFLLFKKGEKRSVFSLL